MNTSRIFNKTVTRRSFLRKTLLASGGLTLATAVATPTAAFTSDSISGMPGEAAHMNVLTGWDQQATKLLAQSLNRHRGSRQWVSPRHVVVPDALAKRQLATIAMNDALETEYFVTQSRSARQPRSAEEAARIIHNLSVWRVRRPAVSENQLGNTVEKVYSISLRDPLFIRKELTQSRAKLLQRSDVLQHYHRPVV